MKRKAAVGAALACLLLLTGRGISLPGPEIPPETLRERGRALYNDGNYGEALEIFERLVFHPRSSTLLAGDDLDMAVTCLRYLNRESEADSLRERAVEARADDWRFLRRVAESYFNATHYGYIVAGEFLRGHHRGGGRYVNSFERDRVRGLQLMESAMAGTEGEAVAGAVAEFYLSFARMLIGYRGYQGAWRLQYLTDLDLLPDYDEGYATPFSGETRGAPVTPDGTPVYHNLPEGYGMAISDGERWRWFLEMAARTDPGRRSQVEIDFADFLHQQFGVQTLGGYGAFFRGAAAGEGADAGRFALHTLSDGETVARLATGVARFPLPAEYNHIAIYRRIADEGSGYAEQALDRLARIFENRRQYSMAAAHWRRSIAEHGDSDRKRKERRIEQIVDGWGQFEPVMTQPAGSGATVEYRFRNGRRVFFEARRIRVDRLLADVKKYLSGNPRQLDRDRMNIAQVGYRLIRESETEYLEGRKARWELELEPRDGHFDRRITVATPLQKAGAYLLTARMEGGNTSHIVLWVSDTVIVHKRLDGENLFFIADAVTGEPLPDVKVDFFGYRQERTDWQRVVGRRYNVFTRKFSYRSDGGGQLIPTKSDFSNDHTWLITATDGEGRLAYLGWTGVWTGRRHDREYKERKTYVITDRPVYRPDQEMKFKVWVRHAQYDQEDTSRYAGQSFTVRIDNPRNEKVFEKQFAADGWGGMAGEYSLPADAVLGLYRITVPGHQGATFRVEEYKKPEFEVEVEAPSEPVMLGEEISSTIRATYYFGAPVTSAKVKYKVLRTPREAEWYPPARWDWFYGPGYWWFSADYDWYPGWKAWGTARPFDWWWPRNPGPPEVVAEAEVPVGEDGTVEVRIDTSFAREVHGDTDHRYEIVAEVTDRSRRTVTGRGEVLVARRPFKVYAWVDRGHYRVGDVVNADFSARTLDGVPVPGKGELRLLAVNYENGEVRELPVQRWDIDTDGEGCARIQIRASRAGQYRLSYRLTDGEGRTEEGGYIFAVRGAGFDGRQYRFDEIEIIPDRKEYGPGDKVRMMVNVDRPGGTALLFLRPSNGVYLRPRLLRLEGKSTVVEIDISKKDMPNFFVEALTVSGGMVHSAVREIVVPPEKRVLDVEVLPSKERYLPGEEARVRFRVTDHAGRPFSGSLAVSVYDRAVEYISGGSNVPEIRAFFWKWRRRHQPRTASSLDRRFANLAKPGEATMQPLGAFGHLVADDGDVGAFGKGGELRGRGEIKMKASAPAAALADAAAPMAEVGMARSQVAEEEGFGLVGGKTDAAPPAAEPAVRKEFADTAFWAAALETDSGGIAEVTFPMPENLTGWKIRSWALGHGTVVGEGTAEVVTAKNLLLRLQAPRFFVEKDEVVLSANVHNYLDRDKTVRAVLELGGGSLERIDLPEVIVEVPAGGEQRVDWRVRAVREGEATVLMKALTDEESDAVEMSFPVFVHGMLKMTPFSGVIRPEEQSQTFTFTVPAQRRIDQSRLEVRYSPTLAGAMVDALPYLVEYPYGCTEQTLNRFLPTVITRKVLLEMGLDLEDIRDKRTNLNAQEIGDDRGRARGWKRWKRNPVFDGSTVRDMEEQGVRRLAAMQLSDGGWGWFSGWGERSWPHTTATVVHGLQTAEANGSALPADMLDRGVRWLEGYQRGELKKLRNAEGRKKPWKERADNLDALVYMVLTDAGRESEAMREYLSRDRTGLSVYALAMFGIALSTAEQEEELVAVMRNIGQYLVEDAENQTAWLEIPAQHRWYWYGSEYEALAYYLKLLSRTEPGSRRSAGLVKYLVNNRKHSSAWNSTRDTALCIEALADYLRASGETRPDMTVEILVDGSSRKTVRIGAENLFTFDNALVLEGDALSSGEHTVEVRREGEGPVYFNAYLTNFTLEDFITAAGLEIRVGRKYYLLERADRTVKAAGSRGQVLDQRVERYERIALPSLSTLTSGDLVEVELEIESKNDYEYIVFEDMKPAGFEPVAVRSGYGGNDMGAYMELRDERVVFFVKNLARGRHSVSYRMRAEIPGRYSALPTRAGAMYAPELKANSDEIKLGVKD